MHDKIAKIEAYRLEHRFSNPIGDSTRVVPYLGFIVVRVITEQGLVGTGVTYNEVGGEAIIALIEKTIAPKIIGEDPALVQYIWDIMTIDMRGIARKGLAFLGMSAIDIALWDIKGKAAALPVFRLLGSERTKIPVYASGGWTIYSEEKLLEEVSGWVKDGTTTVKMKVGVEGGNNIRRDAARVRMIRDHFPNINLLIDANNVWDTGMALRFANMVKDCDIFCFEEPVMADDIPGLARLRQTCGIPIATGEHEYTKYGVRDLAIYGAADVIQADAARCGGYTDSLKIIALTEAFNLKYAPHCMEQIHSHLVSVARNGLFLEHLRAFDPLTYGVFPNAPRPTNGFLTLTEAPGLGLEPDMNFLKEHNKNI